MNDETERPSPELAPTKSGRFSIPPRLTFLLIGGAAIGLIAAMCLVVALIAMIQSS